MVVRRRDTILLSTGRGTGAVVLKFRSKAECLSFSDRLVSLNPDGLSGESRNALADKRPIDDGSNTSAETYSELSKEEEAGRASKVQKRADVLSYMVRLLHDDGFLRFVDDVEQSLTSSEDGPSILAALERRSLAP